MASAIAGVIFAPMNWAHRKWVWPQRMEGLVRMIQPRLRAGERVLDVGCGNGQFGKLLMEHQSSPQGLEFHGVEPEGLIRPETAIPVQAFDGVHLPYEDNAFDVVLLTDVLHHAAEPGPLVAECVRVAKRRVVIKDHVVYGKWDRMRLSFSDWLANVIHGVPCTFGYFSRDGWHEIAKTSGATVVDPAWGPRQYDWGILEKLFGGRLQCVVELEAVGAAALTPEIKTTGASPEALTI